MENRKIVALLDYVRQDYELKCDRDIAAFLGVIYPVVERARGGHFEEYFLDRIQEKTDLSREEIDRFLQ